MKNLIPKSLAKQKAIFYKNISWYDVLVAFIEILFSCGISFGLIFLDWWIRVLIALGIFGILALITLVYNRNNDCRLYKLIWYKIKFLITPKYYNENNTKLLNPYQEIKNNLIYTKPPKDGSSHYVAILDVRGFDISSLDQKEASIKLEQFHNFLINYKKHFTIAKINKKFGFNNQIKFLKEQLQKTKDDYDNAIISEKNYQQKINQINNQIEIYEHIETKLHTNPFHQNFYFVIYDNDYEQINQTIENTINDFSAIGLNTTLLDQYEAINTIKNIYNPMNEDISVQTIEENRLNLDNIFSFNSAKFNKDHILINDQLYLSLLAISDYPTEIDYYWLSFVLLSTNANVVINAKQINQAAAISLINKAIANTASNQFNEKKQVQKMEFEAINEGFKKMSQDIIKNNLCVFQTDIIILNFDVEYKSLMKSNKQIKKIFSNRLIKLNQLKYRQFEALNSFLFKINDSLMKQLGREIPSNTLANGYCFIENNLDDTKGLVLAKNWLNEPVIFNQFILDGNRKNHNMLILGQSGSGKSYFTKKMINWLSMNNKKIFILDIENEYVNLVKHYDGNIINVMNNNGMINPLQIIIHETDLSNMNYIFNHLLVLESFFKILFNEITNQQLRYLINLIKDYYFDYGYDQLDFKKLNNNQWPTFTDIYNYGISEYNKLINLYEENDIKYIHELLRSELSDEGKLAYLYNHHTNIDLNNQLNCFNLHELFENNNTRIIQAQLFLSLNFIQNYINDKNNINQAMMIIIDEAHLLIDENNPVALDFVYQMVKRIRKRNGGIILITQNPDDFLANENIVKKTKAIINNTQYSLFINLSPNNVKDVSEIYKAYGSGLSEQEKLYIAKAKRGQALFFVSGFDRHQIDIYVSDIEKEIF